MAESANVQVRGASKFSDIVAKVLSAARWIFASQFQMRARRIRRHTPSAEKSGQRPTFSPPWVLLYVGSPVIAESIVSVLPLRAVVATLHKISAGLQIRKVSVTFGFTGLRGLCQSAIM